MLGSSRLLIEQELIVKLLPFLKEDFQRERRHFVSHILKTSFRYDGKIENIFRMG